MTNQTKKIKVAINGLGRIGRGFLKLAVDEEVLELVAVNDLADPDNLAYLLKYDSAYGRSGLDVSVRKTGDGKQDLVVNGRAIKYFQIKNPAELPWGDLGIDVAVESTGMFETYEKAKGHIEAGAHKVVISAPVKGEPVPGIAGGTVMMGMNEEELGHLQITSNASCTTNATAPVIKIMHDAIGVDKAILNTIHAYTASQRLVDSPDAKDWRRGRAAAHSIIPSTTGAAISVTEVISDLKGRFDGIALRVPVITGSVSDITFIAKKSTSVEEVNNILKKASSEPRWKGVFSVSEEPLVSADITPSIYASIADLTMTKVVGGNLVKILAWYDNEMGYVHTLLQHVIKAGRAI